MPISPIQNTRLFLSTNNACTEGSEFIQSVTAWSNEDAPGEERVVAAKKIIEAYHNKSVYLELQNLGLRVLPEQIGQLLSLEELFLENNQLTDISVLSTLTNLTELDLDNNQLTDVTALSGLTQLTHLYLFKNQLTDVTGLADLINLVDLNLAENQLISLAGLSKLQSLIKLQLTKNALTDVAGLGGLSKLENLDLDNNQLANVTELSSLTRLNRLQLRNNHLTDAIALAGLTQLEDLNLENNQLTDVTGLFQWPNLSRLNLKNNHLTSLPESFLSLPRMCWVYLDNNRFSEAVIEQLRTIVSAHDYAGPRRIYFSMMRTSEGAAKPLTTVVKNWHQVFGADKPISFAEELWKKAAGEPAAKDFSIFLDRLHNTVNSTQPVFKKKILDWLKRLEKDEILRKEIFLEAREGLGACEDRISLTLNTMKQRELVLNIERGYYDNQLDKLIPLARQAFRIHELEKIAYDKALTLRLIDEVEVYLAYLVKLQKRLSLEIETSEMRFFNVAGVTEVDLEQAYQQVKQNENKHFISYLVDWTPWQSLLERMAPQKYQALQKTLYLAKEAQFFDKQTSELEKNHLAGTEADGLAVAAKVLKSIALGPQKTFTKLFIREQEHKVGGTVGLSKLLRPVWLDVMPSEQ